MKRLLYFSLIVLCLTLALRWQDIGFILLALSISMIPLTILSRMFYDKFIYRGVIFPKARREDYIGQYALTILILCLIYLFA